MNSLPKYYIVGQRPVKVIETEDGGRAIYALSWMTGDFVLAMRYLAEIDKIDSDDVEEVFEEEFTKRVEELQKKIAAKKSG